MRVREDTRGGCFTQIFDTREGHMKIKSIFKSKFQLPQSFLLLSAGIILSLLLMPLAGCSGAVTPQDTFYPSQDFSIELATRNKQIWAKFFVTNPGDSEFPGDRDFKGRMDLWNESGASKSWAEAEILSTISPGESKEIVSFSWDLAPGVYFLTWSEPEYGGTLTAFFVADNLSGVPDVIRSHSFQTKPSQLEGDFSKAGTINSFTLTDDGSVIITGESSLPEQSCLFPLIYSWKGLTDGYPLGECTRVEGGHWQLELPSPSGSQGLQLEEDNSYRVILFSQDLNIPPSEPFEIGISPPVQN